MGRETRLFKSEEQKSRADVSTFLYQLADKISAGQVILRRDEEELALNLPENLVLEVQAEDEAKGTRGVQHSLEVEIKWFDNGQGGPLSLG